MPREKNSIVVGAEGWELIAGIPGDATTHRLKVPGGWLYREYAEENDYDGVKRMAVALCFVPAEAVVEETSQEEDAQWLQGLFQKLRKPGKEGT